MEKAQAARVMNESTLRCSLVVSTTGAAASSFITYKLLYLICNSWFWFGVGFGLESGSAVLQSTGAELLLYTLALLFALYAGRLTERDISLGTILSSEYVTRSLLKKG